MKKIIFILMLMFFPVFLNAETYSDLKGYAGEYMETGDYKFSYNKYIYTPTNNSSFYNNDSDSFVKGGMLNLEEFKITLKNNTRSLYYSYLYEGNPYWTLTRGSSDIYRKIVNGGLGEEKVDDSSSKIGLKVTEYVLPTTSVIGQGTYSDPFLFAPQYKVLIKVNNSERGVMVNSSNAEVSSLEFLVTESDYREIKIKSKGKYGYIGSTCGFILNDIQAGSGKLVLSGVTRDTECTINFGERPTTVILDQSLNNKSVSNPDKLYIIPELGWYTDEFANYSLVTLISNPSRVGYTYNGYYKSTSSSNACDGTLVIGTDKKLSRTKSLLDSFVNNQTLYPCYEANTYTVTFDKNTGDTLTKTSMNIKFDDNYGELPTASKTGYTFVGWYTDAQYGEKIESTTKMDVEGNHTLYAHWTPNTNTVYTVRHHLQKVGGGSEQNSTNYPEVKVTTHTGTSDYEVIAPRESYTGFKTPENSNKVKIDRFGNSVVDYYYTRESYTVTFNKNGRGSPSFGSYEIQYEANYKLPTISATGYTFNGWYTAASGGTKVTESTKLTNANPHTLYAQWTINKYTLTLNKGTGISAVSGAGTYDYNSIRNIDATVQAGYHWVNWTGDITSSIKAHSFNLPARNITLTANAQGNPYAVSYNCNGGSGTAPSASNHVYGTSSAVRTNTCSKTGYLFASWNTKADGSGTTISNGGNVSTLTTTYNGTVTLYAQWTPITYYIVFAANSGSGSMSKMTLTYTQVANLTANSFTRTGHRFDGWSGSNGSNYADKASVTKLASTNGATVTMTARWTKCSAGTYLSNNTCTSCPAGTYSSGGVNSCTTCSAGTYNTTTGNTSCKACDAGYYCTGGSSITKCSAGKYSTSTGATTASVCSSCPAGYYCPGGSERVSCGDGYTSNSGASSSSNCLKYTCSSGTLTKDSSLGYVCVSSASTSTSSYACGSYECGSYVCGSHECGSYVCGSYACGSYACGTEQIPNTVDNCCYRCGGSYTSSYACCSACGTTTTYTTQTKYCTSYCNSYCTSYCDTYCPSYCTSYCTSTSYYCPSGWSEYSGSDSSLRCYKAASY